jgi:hypothetical protein
MQNANRELQERRGKNGRSPQPVASLTPPAFAANANGRIKPVPAEKEPDIIQGKPVTLASLDLSWHPKMQTAVNAARAWQELRRRQLAENKRQHEANEEITVRPNASLVLLASQKDPVHCTGYGCGKTHIAKAVLWSEAFLLDDQPFAPTGNFYEAGRLLGNLDGETRPSAEITGPILVIDDVGTEGTIPFVAAGSQEHERHARYFKAINYCYDKGVSVVITANLTTHQLAAHIGGRAWSRLLEMAPQGLIVDLTGVPDYRRRQGGR